MTKKVDSAATTNELTYYDQATITCACGNTFKVGSTKPEIHVEICSKCHPFYTGVKKLVDEGGRVTRFTKLTAHSKAASTKLGGKKQRLAKRAKIKSSKKPKVEKE